MEEIISSLVSQESYKSLRDLKLAIKDGDLYQIHKNHRTAIKNATQAIILVLQREEYQPLQKLLSLRLCKEGVDTFNYSFVKEVADKILPLIVMIALFDKTNQSDDRGKFFFSVTPNKTEIINGKSMVRLSMECIYIWAIWFPKDFDSLNPSNFKLAYEKLSNDRMKFPTTLTYFKQEDIDKFNGAQSAVVQRLPTVPIQQTNSEIIGNKPAKVRPIRNDSQTSIQRSRHESTPGGDQPNQTLTSQQLEIKTNDLLKQSANLKKEIAVLCQRSKPVDPIPSQLNIYVEKIKEHLEKSNNLLQLLLDKNDDLFGKVFDEQQWMEKVVEDYPKLGKQFGITWSDFQQDFLNQSQMLSNSMISSKKLNHKDREIEDLAHQLHLQNQEVDKLRKENQKLHQELALRSEKIDHFTMHQQTFSQVQDQHREENESLRLRLDQMTQQLAHATTSKEQHISLTNQINELQARHHQLQQVHDQLVNQNIQLKQDHHKLQESHRLQHNELSKKESFAAGLEHINLQLKQEVEALRIKLREKESLPKQQQDIEISEKLRAQINQLQTHNRTLEDKMNQHQNHITQLEQDIDVLQKENFNLHKLQTSQLYEQQYRKNLQNTTQEKKEMLTVDLAEHLSTIRKKKEELQQKHDELEIQLISAQDIVKLYQADIIEKDHHIVMVEEKCKQHKKEAQVLQKKLELFTEQIQHPSNQGAYNELLKNYHQSIEDKQRLDNALKMSSIDQQKDFENKLRQVTQEKDSLIDQLYKLHEENTLLIRENEKLRDSEHQLQISMMQSNKKVQPSQASSVAPDLIQYNSQPLTQQQELKKSSAPQDQRKARFPETFNFSHEEIGMIQQFTSLVMMKLQTEEPLDPKQYDHVIFPHATSRDYYDHKIKKNPKGQIVDQHRVLQLQKPLEKIQNIHFFIGRSFGVNGLIVKSEIEAATMIVKIVGRQQQSLKISFCVYLFNRTRVNIPVTKLYCQQYNSTGDGTTLRTNCNFNDGIESGQQGRIELEPYQFLNAFELIKLSLQYTYPN